MPKIVQSTIDPAAVPPIRRVLLVGATHGNELTGAYLIKKLERHPELIQRSTFETVTLLANPQALAQNRRYIDTDLNRCFRLQNLEHTDRCTYEDQRAREIYAQFGRNGSTPADLILDLHSTTAALGVTFITYPDRFNLQLAAYLQQINPAVQVLILPRSAQGYTGLPSMGRFGGTIEVGPIAPGVLQAEQFQRMQTVLLQILDCLEAHNQGQPLAFHYPSPIYQQIGTLDYPRDQAGDIAAMIHPALQFQDYQPLHPGDPVFQTFEGETLAHAGEVVYPIFINEAAYYEKGIAMVLTQPLDLTQLLERIGQDDDLATSTN